MLTLPPQRAQEYAEPASPPLGDHRHVFSDTTPLVFTVPPTFRPIPLSAAGVLGALPELSLLPRTLDVADAGPPPVPRIHSVVPLLRWQRHASAGLYTSERTCVGCRVYLRRWHDTGAGGRLGVLAFNAGATSARLLEAQQYVTRWGSDPLDPAPPGPAPHTYLDTAGDAVPNATEIVPDIRLREIPANVAASSYGITVAGHEVRFDAERDLWYADVELTLPDPGLQFEPEPAFSFVRLALVRYQPLSVDGCQVSSVVHADLAELPPRRALTAMRLDASSMQIAFSGPRLPHGRANARFHHRVAPDASPALGTTRPMTATATGGHVTYAGVLCLPPPATAPAGRVLVRELQDEWSLVAGRETDRVVYLETFDTALVLPTG